ncbi:hypothetical protein N7E81_10970 [Reichenbachiella carrageenanivorans]|uniref:Uncharacterized protein n=1 Tax=Reichenbachiella carrageenanivorans TaxID=2979869 RepID=A0ABY6CW03_9BACT|nr:hypothetical protein [Reichenbachiella carrageenanivorans]UXX77889.1 hypothetical protein N7E81_10970 [Reichenbachiella carrageenanivorans]
MKTSTSILFLRFIEKKTKIQDFEKWIYESESLEEELPDETYTELISLDFNDKSIRKIVTELVFPLLDVGNAHKQQLIELISEILDKKIDPIAGISELHYNWLDEKGYLFLSNNTTIANFGEQGKSIVSRTDFSNELTIDEKWKLVKSDDTSFIDYLVKTKTKLEDGRIRLTGNFKEVKFYGLQFEYEEKSTQQHL